MRFVDDSFLIFNDRDQHRSQHRSIKFTLETKNNGSLPFLDVLVSRTVEGFVSTSLFTKHTFFRSVHKV